MSAPQQPPVAALPPTAARPGWFGRIFRAFHYRNFRIMWAGAFTSTSGTFVQEFAQSWLVYQLTDDEFLLGLTVFLNNAPVLLFSLVGGVLADRMDRRKLLLASQYIQTASALALAVLVWTNLIEIWHILAAAFLNGTGQAFGGPAYQALIPSLVDDHDLPNEIALMSIQFNLAQVIGFALGGVIFAAIGAGACFFVNSLSFGAVIVSLFLLPSTFVPSKTQTHPFESLREGLRFVFRNHAMAALVVLAMTTAFLGVPVRTLLPVFAEDVFNLGGAGYSAMGAVFGAGAVAGALIVAWMGNARRKGLRALMMQAVLGVATFFFALSTVLWASYSLLLISGAAVLALFASINALVQLIAPENMRGRIMSVYNTAFRGSMAVGPAVAGYFARHWGAPAVIAVNGVLLLVIAIAFLLKDRQIRAL